MVADLATVATAMATSIALSQSYHHFHDPSAYRQIVPLLTLVAGVFTLFALYPGIIHGPVFEIRRCACATSLVFLLFSLAKWFLHAFRGAGSTLLAWMLAIVLLPAARSLVRHLGARANWWGYPIVVIASWRGVRALLPQLRRERHLGLRPVAIFVPAAAARIEGIPVLTEFDLIQEAAKAGVKHALIVNDGSQFPQLSAAVSLCETLFPHVMLMSNVGDIASYVVRPHELGSSIALELRNNLLLRGPRLAKRTLDVLATSVLLLLCLPLFPLIMAAILLESPGNPLYSQWRIGRNGNKFRVWKFRTMVVNGEAVLRDCLSADSTARSEWERDHKLRVDPRITRVGNFLRKTSLDELPQLWNVLCAQMSLVGPRPICDPEVAKYGKSYALYQRVSPGISGLWQVSGRNDLPYYRRVALDSYYVRNWSPWLDIYLLARTIGVVLRRSGAY